MSSRNRSTVPILGVVLAGGEGTRLRPLTLDHAKPAIPLTERHRLIDFVLSNLFNSGIRSIYVLAQYHPISLIEHLRRHWMPRCASTGGFLRVLLPGVGAGSRFAGTADAVYRSLSFIERHRPRRVAVFAADHVYRMDVRQMEAFHRARSADVTVAATAVPLDSAKAFGVVAIDEHERIRAFDEKPARPAAMPSDSARALASMGNYLFEAPVLRQLLSETVRRGGSDFGHHVIPALAGHPRAYVYDFTRNRIPGLQPWEERAYWRDVGTLCAYRASVLDVRCAHPKLELDNPAWPIHGAITTDAVCVRPRMPDDPARRVSTPEAEATA